MPAKPIEILCESAIEVEGSPDQPKKFSVRAYNGGKLRVNQYDLPVVIDISGMQEARSIVANLHHDKKAIVGHVTKVERGQSTVDLSGTVSGAGPAKTEFLEASGNGFPWQASIEYLPDTVQEIAAGKSETVNGKPVLGPAYVARSGRLYGVAFLPRGADENTTVIVASPKEEVSPKGNAMPPELKEWIEAGGFEVDKLNEKQIASLKAQWEATKQKPEIEAEYFDASSISEMINDARDEIEASAAEVEENILDKKKFNEIKAAAKKSVSALKSKAIREKWSEDKLRAECTEIRANAQLALLKVEAPTGMAIHMSQRDESPEVIEAAFAMRMNRNTDSYKPEVLQKAHENFRGGIGIQQVLLMAAAQNGYRVMPGERIGTHNLRTILAHAMPTTMINATGFSTMGVSVSNMLSNVATKELVAGYEEGDQTWRQISAIKSVNDFKTITTYRLTDNMSYELVGPAGEIKHGTIGQESYTRAAKTYAKMFALTREDMINDDLGAFNDIRARLGRGASMALNDKFWATFLDNSTFFTSGRGNYISGGTTNLGSDGVGLGLGVKAFRNMKSAVADGAKKLGGNPSILLVPPELEVTADELYSSRNRTGGSSTVLESNTHVGKYRPLVCPWLNDTSITGYSTTAWYLLRDPATWATIVVSFLNNQQTPTVESAEADFNQLGIQFRGYHDFGVDMAEYVGGVKSAGA